MQMVSKTPCRRRRIVTNRLMCGSTIRKIHSVGIGKSSEITEIVRVKWCSHFVKKLEFVSRYLVSMRTRCSP